MPKIHKTEIAYEGGLEKLTNDIGDLQYDILEDFLEKLSNKIYQDALADYDRNRKKLSFCLNSAHYFIRLAKDQIKEAWKISAPHMKINDAYLIEVFIDRLKIKYAHWLFDGNDLNEEPIVAKFIDWCVKDLEKDLHAKRAKDGKSFFERRAEKLTSSQSDS
jgi:hypothetical protein